MKVTMKDGTVKNMHVTQCHGYAADQVVLDREDLIALARMSNRDRGATILQLCHRVYRPGEPEYERDFSPPDPLSGQ